MEGTDADPSLNAHAHPSPPPLPPQHTQSQSHPHPHSHSHRSSARQGHGHGHHDKDGERASFKVKIPGHKSTRYKEKFQALRERYDRVIAIHDEHKHDFDVASEKMRRLQAENDLLLDAIYVSAPDLIHLVPPASGPHHHPGHDSQHPTPAPVFPSDVVDHGHGHGHSHVHEPNMNHTPNHMTDHIQTHDQSRSHSHSHNHTHSHSHTRSSSLQRPAAASGHTVVENGNSNANVNGVAANSRVEEVETEGREPEPEHVKPPYDEGRG